MLKIGEFSKLGQVTVTTLRHYGEIGLLKPVLVDDYSGYRYYSIAQLPRLNRILALKNLGFSLEEIAPLLDSPNLTERIRVTLQTKRAEIEARLSEEQSLLARVEARLRQIEGEEKMAEYDVVVKSVAPQTVASVRETVPTFRDAQFLLPKLTALVKQSRLHPAGNPYMIWHLDEYKECDIDAELCIPISEKDANAKEINVYSQPGIDRVATAVQKGMRDFETSSLAIVAWIEQNGYQIVGHTRHIYLEPDLMNLPAGFSPDQIITEVQIPVTRAA